MTGENKDMIRSVYYRDIYVFLHWFYKLDITDLILIYVA